jgi:hypothetical protein
MSTTRLSKWLTVKQTVTPSQFINITKRNASSIKQSRFVAPTLGKKNDFGSLEVEYFHGAKR